MSEDPATRAAPAAAGLSSPTLERPRPPAARADPLARRFAAVLFDWDGTAVAGRADDAHALGEVLDALVRRGMRVAVVTGTRFDHIDRQLGRSMRGAGREGLLVSTNRGSELWGYDASGEPVLRWRRVATPEEETRLDAAADALRDAIVARTGLPIAIIRDRVNRRKVDLIPEWPDPPKARIGELVRAVEKRLGDAGWTGGLAAVLGLAETVARGAGLPDPRITSDVKHVEIGLTDKGDAARRIVERLDGVVSPGDLLVVGDEFGAIGGVIGSDALLRNEATRDATFVSVGAEPGGAPEGVLHLPGGPARFLELMERQLALRPPPKPRPPRYEGPPADPASVLVEEGFALLREHEIESCFAVSNGTAGVRGALSEGTPLSAPATRLAGRFVRDAPEALPELALAPDFTRLTVSVDGVVMRIGEDAPEDTPQRTLEHTRELDLVHGVVWRTWRHEDPSGRITRLRYARYASLADRRLLAERVTIHPENWTGDMTVTAAVIVPAGWSETADEVWEGPGTLAHASRLCEPEAGPVATIGAQELPLDGGDRRHHDERRLRGERRRGPEARSWTDRRQAPLATTVARWDVISRPGVTWTLDRMAVIGGPEAEPARLGELAEETVQRRSGRELDEHTRAFAARVEACDVELDGDTGLQRALRFAGYHLIGAANPDDDHVSIGARGLTGAAYMGHVFWDTEIWLLPFYTLTWPRAARALLMYRWHTLPAARERARKLGYAGALYAWESADTGEDVTPQVVRMPDGRVVPVLCGRLENHVSAAIAWATWQYWEATRDDLFLLDAGAEMVLETARFWAIRGGFETDGRFHIRGVIGPDEYHENVDDNAYTNGMAQWNLRKGAELTRLLTLRWPDRMTALAARLGLSPEEVARWEAAAEAMYTGLDPRTGIYEQFEGFNSLEHIDLAAFEPRSVAMDVLLGHERVARSQILKQADVVLMIALLWDQIPPAIREANFRYYEPRTAHGSSLSPSVHALVAARLGDVALAERYFRQTAAIDLDNRFGNAAGGVHIGALGGLWQAAVLGFGGLSCGPEGPRLEPHLPAFCRELRFPFEWRRERLLAEIGPDHARIRRRSP